jgi:hypothetical protein
MADFYASIQGIVYAAVRDANGKPGKLYDMGNAPKISVSLKSDVSIKKEARSGFRLPAKRLSKGFEAELALTLDEFTLDNLALGLYGTVVTKAAGTVTGELLPTGLAAGDRAQLANPKVSTVVVKDSAGTPATLALNTNYTVDADSGHIIIVSPGAFVQPFKVDYGYAASKKVGAFTQAAPERMIILEGLNTLDNNRRVRVTVFRTQMDPLGDLGLIHDDYGSIELKGSALADGSRASSDPMGQFLSYEYLDA